MEKHLMAIPNRCTGCNRCAYACSAVKEGMFMPSKARVQVNNFAHDGYSVPNVCFHCPKAACMEACPTDAIAFGNINDPESEVSKLKALNRDYALLGELNLQPRTSYGAKLRNLNPELVDAHDMGGHDDHHA